MLIRARYSSTCVRCSRPIHPGEVVSFAPETGTVCEGCHKAVEDAERAACERGQELLHICGQRSGAVWNQGILDDAVNFGIAAQYRDQGTMVTVERYKLRGVPLAVQTVYIDGGKRSASYLWGPQDVIRAAQGGRGPSGAMVKVKTPAPTVQAPQAPAGPIVVEPLPKPADDPAFRSKSKPAPEHEGLIIGLDKASGLFWTQVSSAEARDALKSAGFRFHLGGAEPEGDEKKCHSRCYGCAAQLQDRVWCTRDARVARRFLRYLSPEAREAAESTRSAFEDSRASSANIVVPVPKGLSYYPYQLAGIRWCLERPSALLSDEPGLGKSIEILGLINADESIKRVLVISPASLTLNWRDEAKKWLVRPTLIQVLEDSSQLQKNAERILAITNFEMLIRHRGHNLYGSLLSATWNLIAVDEAHRLCNQREAKISQSVLGIPPKQSASGAMTLQVPGLMSRAMRRILLTGTPFKNRPRELWPLVHALDPNHFDNEYGFMLRYCGGEDEHRGRRKFDGASNLDELQDRLRCKSHNGKGMMIRRLKIDVLPELPPKTRHIISLPVPRTAAPLVNMELKSYAKDRSDIDAALATSDMMALRGLHMEYRGAVEKMHAAGKIAFNRMAALRHEVGLAKAPVVVEHVSSMLDDGLECVIVFAHHHDVINILMEGLAKYNPVKITGAESKAQKHRAVRTFQTDLNCRVVVANITAAGEGITLNRASTVVICELTFVPGQITQAEDRAHRIGQANAVFVYHLVFDGSVDQRIAKILVEKTGMSEEALDIERFENQDGASEALRQATLQRMSKGYPDAVRQITLEAISSITGFKPAWSLVGNWVAAQSTLNDWQCDLALRCLRHHRSLVSVQLRAQLGLKKKSA